MQKNYLVIGASTGIGRALALELAAENNAVIGTYHKNPTADSTNLKYHAYDCLETNPDFSFIPNELHGLAYCVGAIALKPFQSLTAEDYLNDYKLQVIGAIKTIKAALPALRKNEGASVVLFSTIAVQTGFKYHAAVATSKGAIEGLTKALAAEFAPKIRVNAIAPSLTNTPLAQHLLSTPEKTDFHNKQNPLQRIGQPQDIAQTAAFLLSEKSSWMSGQILHVDGGMGTLKI